MEEEIKTEPFLKRVANVQQWVKAPKTAENKFGGYKYRTVDAIISGAKTALGLYDIVLLMTEDIVLIGDRYYVRCTATLQDCMSEQHLETVAYAREDDAEKGKSAPQVTGTASTYARKRALSGLFALDNDDVDPDTEQVTQTNLQPLQAKSAPQATPNTQKKDAVQSFDQMKAVDSVQDKIKGVLRLNKDKKPKEKAIALVKNLGFPLELQKQVPSWLKEITEHDWDAVTTEEFTKLVEKIQSVAIERAGEQSA